jgi:predicted phage terminase large subunit-like protein
MSSDSSVGSLVNWIASDPTEATLRLEALLCRASLAEFFRASWHVMEGDKPLGDNWHVDAICDHIQAALEGWIARQADPSAVVPIKDILVNVPPGTLKSRIVSVCAPAWMWTRYPAWKGIFLSSNPRVALRDASYSRELIESDWYQETFRPEWTLAEDQNAKGLFRNTAGGFRQSQGISAKITGDRADAIFVDDPHDAEEVKSRAAREEVVEKWKSAICNRVNDPGVSIRVGIMQRLHAEDWSWQVLTEGWTHLCIRQEFDPSRDSGVSPIGWRDPRTAEGELLFPARFGPAYIAAEKARLGSEGYAGQHQQDPVPAGGGRFKRAWLCYFDRVDDDPAGIILRLRWPDGRTKLVPLAHCRIFGTVDLANSLKKSADYTVLALWAVTPHCELILLDLVRDRMEDPDIVPSLIRLQERWKPGYWGIEANGIGLGIVQSARRSGLAVQAVYADTDKIARSSTAVIRCEAGQVFLPASAPWLIDFETELLTFPKTTHDDQVDVLSLAAIDVFRTGGPGEPPEEIEKAMEAAQKARSEEWHKAENPAWWPDEDDD